MPSYHKRLRQQFDFNSSLFGNLLLVAVPADWQHPKDASDKFILLRHPKYMMTGDEEQPVFACDYLKPQFIMPSLDNAWHDKNLTHWQMYNETEHGYVPVSPVMKTLDALAKWLTENFEKDGYKFTPQAWINFIQEKQRDILITQGKASPTPSFLERIFSVLNLS